MKIKCLLMKKIILLLLICISGIQLVQADSYFFYVQLKDKNNSPYTLSDPAQYLSARAIARRASFNISCDSTDLPVNPDYIQQISSIAGATVYCRSKWLNGVTVLVSDSALVIPQIRSLGFVKFAKYTGLTTATASVRSKSKFLSETLDYGNASTQINQIKTNYLHNLGYTGKNIVIAVLDAGFYNANANPGFDSLRVSGRLLGTKDIAERGANVYSLDSHGSNVLSIMTGKLDGTTKFAGSAPHASFWLIRTEYAATEYPVETDFWNAGIEFADSVGADVVNSSLGYTEFDDSKLNYSYSDMNGTVSHASLAAHLAAQKGIIVCNSAGNSASDTWHYIGAPADADGIITVGAVTSTGTASYFSSYGPTSDGRIKPDVCAMGSSTAYINTNGTPVSENGTSYSSPVMAGTMACYLQYAKANYTEFSIADLIQAVRESASLYTLPEAQRGYGIPDFQIASVGLATKLQSLNESDNSFLSFYNNDEKKIHVRFDSLPAENTYIRLYNIAGELIFTLKAHQIENSISASPLPAGIYIVNVSSDQNIQSVKVAVR